MTGPTTSACLWCGHEERYWPNRGGSLTRAKSRMATHELSCERSPVVQEMDKLRSVNALLTSVFQKKEGAPTVLELYINPRRKSPVNVVLDDLGALARDTAPDDDVIAYLRRDTPCGCAICGDITRPAVSMRIIAPTLTHVAILCQGCHPTEARTPKQVIEKLTEVGELGVLEMAFLWKEGARTRMLWGDKLKVETIR